MLQGISSTKAYLHGGILGRRARGPKDGEKGCLAHQIFTNSSSTCRASLFAKYPNCSISSQDSLNRNFESTCPLIKKVFKKIPISKN